MSGIIHISDLHMGHEAEPAILDAVQDLVPDLEPRAIVLSGDLCKRARHGEFLAARALVRELKRTAPVLVLPGNHDVQWWWRPLIPFAPAAKYRKYVRYFGPTLNPTVSIPEVIIASVLTAHGMAWGSLTLRIPDMAVVGHLPKTEIERVARVFKKAEPSQLRVLVVHHNVLKGEISGRIGLARWKRAQRRIVDCGAEVVMCGHDHQECAETLDGRVVVSCAGSLCSRTRGELPATFNRITWDEDQIRVEFYKWELDRGLFKRNDVHAFGRSRRPMGERVSGKTV